MDPGWDKKSTIPGSRNTPAVLAFSCCSQSQGPACVICSMSTPSQGIGICHCTSSCCTVTEFPVLLEWKIYENMTLQGSWIRCVHVPAAQQWLKTWVRRSSWNTPAVRESQRHGAGGRGELLAFQIACKNRRSVEEMVGFQHWDLNSGEKRISFPASLACKKSWPMAVNNPQQKFPNVTSSCQAFVSYKTVPTMPTTNYVFSLAELWWTMDKRWINTDPKSWYPTKRLG